MQNVQSEEPNDEVKQPEQNAASSPYGPGPRGQPPYMVDPSNINYLLRQFGHPRDGRPSSTQSIEEYLYRAMIERFDQSTVHSIQNLRSQTFDRLVSQGAFYLPPYETKLALLDVFFNSCFSYMPILDKQELTQNTINGVVSSLLLNSVFMVATIYSPDSLIAKAGFSSRFIATLTFYHRAKDIYDAGYETDIITVIQSTFLMSHWWSGPLEQKDPWYWLGIAVGMAQSHGINQLYISPNSIPVKFG